MKLMHVDTSPKKAHSSSKMLSAYFVAQLQTKTKIETDYLDISIETPPHLSHTFIEAMLTPATERSRDMQQTLVYSDHLCARVLMSDMLVFAMPMYNFSMPSSFKAFIDNLVRLDLTFRVNSDGSTCGHLSRQKVLFITTRGADFRPASSPWTHMDALTPALKSAFSFMGADHIEFVDVQPLENNDLVARTEILNQARQKLDTIARRWINAI